METRKRRPDGACGIRGEQARQSTLLRDLIGESLSESRFDRIMSHLEETLKELELPEAETKTVLETLEATHDDVLDRS